MWRASSEPARVPVTHEPIAATTWSMAVGSSSASFALFLTFTPPYMPVRMTCGNCAWRVIQGNEAMHILRKSQLERVVQGDSLAQNRVNKQLFGLAA